MDRTSRNRAKYGGSGAHRVKTYGRIRQRIVTHETQSAQQLFSQATVNIGNQKKLNKPSIFDYSSSDSSDFDPQPPQTLKSHGRTRGVGENKLEHIPTYMNGEKPNNSSSDTENKTPEPVRVRSKKPTKSPNKEPKPAKSQNPKVLTSRKRATKKEKEKESRPTETNARVKPASKAKPNQSKKKPKAEHSKPEVSHNKTTKGRVAKRKSRTATRSKPKNQNAKSVCSAESNEVIVDTGKPETSIDVTSDAIAAAGGFEVSEKMAIEQNLDDLVKDTGPDHEPNTMPMDIDSENIPDAISGHIQDINQETMESESKIESEQLPTQLSGSNPLSDTLHGPDLVRKQPAKPETASDVELKTNPQSLQLESENIDPSLLSNANITKRKSTRSQKKSLPQKSSNRNTDPFAERGTREIEITTNDSNKLANGNTSDHTNNPRPNQPLRTSDVSRRLSEVMLKNSLICVATDISSPHSKSTGYKAQESEDGPEYKDKEAMLSQTSPEPQATFDLNSHDKAHQNPERQESLPSNPTVHFNDDINKGVVEEREEGGDLAEYMSDESTGSTGIRRVATRTMRFKAPHNARAQTYEIEDEAPGSEDIEMEESEAQYVDNDSHNYKDAVVDGITAGIFKDTQVGLHIPDPARLSTPKKTYNVMPRTPELPSTHTPPAPTSAISLLPMQQQRQQRQQQTNKPQTPMHSPSRIATPHRVVYSPCNPKTQARYCLNPNDTIENNVSSPLKNPPLMQQIASINGSMGTMASVVPKEIKTSPVPTSELHAKPHPSQHALLQNVTPKLHTQKTETQNLDANLELKHQCPEVSSSAQDRRNSSEQRQPRSARKSSLTNGDSDREELDLEDTRVPFLPARRYVQKAHILAACGQKEPIDWVNGGLQACGVLLPELDESQHSENELGRIESEAGLCKIGEATYSEVFSAQWRYVPRTRYDKFNSKKGKVRGERVMQVALKVIPFGNSKARSGSGDPLTTLRDLYQEIGATLALSRLSERERAKLQEVRTQVNLPLKSKERELGANFVKAFRVCICQGPMPAPLLRAWDRWNAEYPELCENARPDYYSKDQMFAVFVLEMGGETLENATVSTWKEARSIVRQLALSMALAERSCQFEHRDLHWGNIMVTRYNGNLTFLYQLPPLGARVKSTLLSLPSYKVRCTIIDYTLSRLHIDNDPTEHKETPKPTNYDPDNNVFYVALKDKALFQGEGDIQFDVYRQMQTCSKDDWAGYHPRTNVLWLTYVLQKLITTKSPKIKDELIAFANSKVGREYTHATPEIKRAAGQELLRKWIYEFEQSESCTQILKCALLDLYKN